MNDIRFVFIAVILGLIAISGIALAANEADYSADNNAEMKLGNKGYILALSIPPKANIYR